MFNYEEVTNDVRQDKITDMEKEEPLGIVRYPTKPIYFEEDLRGWQMAAFYDTTVHLGLLKITAHKINERFQKDMEKIFDINPKTGYSSNMKVLFRSGPVKDIVRSKSKVENDYAREAFPTSAKIGDFIRCSLVFGKCEDCVEAIEILRKAAREGKTCVKGIGRIKNM